MSNDDDQGGDDGKHEDEYARPRRVRRNADNDITNDVDYHKHQPDVDQDGDEEDDAFLAHAYVRTECARCVRTVCAYYVRNGREV